MWKTKSRRLNLDNCLNLILTNNQTFISDVNVVYKSCGNKWIVVMKKLDDTITNESRKNVVDSNHAKFRASKLLVLKIFNKFDCDKTCQMICSDYDANVIYKVGEVVFPNGFNKNLESYCSTGIHYYKTIETAFYHNIGLFPNGTHKEWHPNGNKFIIHILNKGNGIKAAWHSSGGISQEGHIKKGERHGLWKSWYPNGKISVEENYSNGQLHGKKTTWYKDGKPKSQYYYLRGEKHGTEISWENDIKMAREFKNGKQISQFRVLLNESWLPDKNFIHENSYHSIKIDF